MKSLEGSAPGYEVPALLELTGKQGSTQYMWWTSAEPKLAVSVTSVTNKVNSFFRGRTPATSAFLDKASIRIVISCSEANLYLATMFGVTLPIVNRRVTSEMSSRGKAPWLRC